MLNRNNAIVVLLFALFLVKTGAIELPNFPILQKVDRVTYVYEKDDVAVPRPVSYSLAELSKQGIVATELEVDPENGLGQIPLQDQISVDAAKAAGLPAVVVQSGERVMRVVNSPTTVSQMVEASGLAIEEPQ